MKLNTLTPVFKSIKSKKRIGRGQGSGRGGTSTRGHKGAKSRSGYKRKIGFEGGQTPLKRRITIFGFKRYNRITYKVINLSDIQRLVDKKKYFKIDKKILLENSLISKNDKFKILGMGSLKVKLEIFANAFSSSSLKIIKNLGGKAIII